MANTVVEQNSTLENEASFQSHLSNVDLDWLKEIKENAWKQFLEIPEPRRMDEKWRFSKLDRIREIGSYKPAGQQELDAAAILDRSHRFKEISGRLVFANDTLIADKVVDPDLESKGVIFTTLLDAMIKHPDLVRKYFLSQSPGLGSEKFEALHIAYLRNGAFLYVPDNVEIEKPFVVYNWSAGDGEAIFPHTVFISGKHAKASLVEFQESVESSGKNLAVANASVFADAGSSPKHTIIQNYNLETLSLQLNTNNGQQDTNAKSIMINVGSAQARQEVHGKIFGSGANVEIYSLSVPKGKQEFDQRTLQSHNAPHSRSDLLFKNALFDDSRTIFSGLIIVEKDAQQTDAYQTNNNLMLSDSAESNSLPGLEINANDVKCSHGSTTGKMDDSDLFYFLARGIPKKKAQELLVYGYFEEIIEKIDTEELVEYVRELVRHKFID